MLRASLEFVIELMDPVNEEVKDMSEKLCINKAGILDVLLISYNRRKSI